MNRGGNPETKSRKRQNAKTQDKQKMKVAQKQPRAPKLGQISDYKDLPKALSGTGAAVAYARQTMLPGGPAILIPDEAEHPRCARVFRRTITINSENILASGPDTGSCLIMLPADPEMPGYTTVQGESLLPAAPGQLMIKYHHLRFAGSSAGLLLGEADITTFEETPQNAKTPLKAITLGGVSRSGVHIAAAGAGTCKCTVMSMADVSKPRRAGVYTATAAGWTLKAQSSILVKNSPQTLDFTTDNNCVAVAVGFLNAGNDDPYYESEGHDASAAVTLELGVVGSNDSYQFSSLDEKVLYNGIEKFITENSITKARLTAVGALLTNTSPLLERGGNISVARADPSIVSEFSDIQGAISRLPENRRYTGDAAKGGYVWWFPGSASSQNLKDISEARSDLIHDKVLLFYLTGLGVGEGKSTSFLLTINWVVEFYSNKQAFEKLQPPPINQKWLAMQYTLSVAPACTCNPEHEGLFNQILNKGRAAYEHYKENEALYNSLLVAISSLAKAMG